MGSENDIAWLRQVCLDYVADPDGARVRYPADDPTHAARMVDAIHALDQLTADRGHLIDAMRSVRAIAVDACAELAEDRTDSPLAAWG